MTSTMEVITYLLRDRQKRSDQYYKDVAVFTDNVLTEAEGRTRTSVEAFQTYLQQTRRETLRTCAEYTFELLTLGVLWRVYAGDTLRLAEAPRRVLTRLVQLRQRGGRFGQVIDRLRGVLATIFLSPDGRHPGDVPAPTLDRLERLLSRMGATGDFNEEVKRLRAWQDFLLGRPAEKAIQDLAAAISLAAWFEARGEAALGRYTPHVEQFLAETHPFYRWREDAIFCGRRRVEYHLNMVGTEILNRAFREPFLRTKRKLVLLPPCMKRQPDYRCRARSTPFGALCAGCTPDCRVHRVTQLGQRLGFETLILPDELSVFSGGAVKPMDSEEIGVVGVSCVLTNVTGGWETRALNIPAQGVLLDYCGCSWHWHEKGIPTDVNVGQLLRVLGIDQGTSQEILDEEQVEAAFQS
jgi:hypothetical protein